HDGSRMVPSCDCRCSTAGGSDARLEEGAEVGETRAFCYTAQRAQRLLRCLGQRAAALLEHGGATCRQRLWLGVARLLRVFPLFPRLLALRWPGWPRCPRLPVVSCSRRATPAERRQHGLEDRQHARSPFGAYDEIPHRLTLLPAPGIGDMPQALAPALVGP